MLATCGLTFSENWMTTRGGGAWTSSRGEGLVLTGRAWAAALGTKAKSENASPVTSVSQESSAGADARASHGVLRHCFVLTSRPLRACAHSMVPRFLNRSSG